MQVAGRRLPMTRRGSRSIPEPITELQQQLTQFRSANKPRTKLPEPVWQAAVALAKQYGFWQTARPLRLDYMGLKRRLLGSEGPKRKAAKPAFVELVATRQVMLDEYEIEFESGQGEKMRVRWKAAAAPDWGEPAARLAGSAGMIQVSPQMRVLVAIEPVDGRKGIDSLVRLCQDKLSEDPFSGCVFVFRSRSGTAIRLLSYDGQGLKRAVLHRKNALFYRTLNGAQVGDLFMSLIHTCQLCGANSFDYLTELQSHARELAANPAEWMPWNYSETLIRAGVEGRNATI
jgi:hypothetical protein